MITALVCVCDQEETIEMQKGESERLKKERERRQMSTAVAQMQQEDAAAKAALRSSRNNQILSTNAPWQQP